MIFKYHILYKGNCFPLSSVFTKKPRSNEANVCLCLYETIFGQLLVTCRYKLIVFLCELNSDEKLML